MRKVIDYICKKQNCELKEFNGEEDHVHLLINYPPKLAISKLVNSIKGVSSRRLRQNYSSLKLSIILMAFCGRLVILQEALEGRQ